LAFCLVASLASLSADPVTIKGKTGAILTFEIQKITAEGFLGTRKDNGQTLFVSWQLVDLDWLKANQPAVYKSLNDASVASDPFAITGTGAPAASAPASSSAAAAAAPSAPDAAPPAIPTPPPHVQTVPDIVAELLQYWKPLDRDGFKYQRVTTTKQNADGTITEYSTTVSTTPVYYLTTSRNNAWGWLLRITTENDAGRRDYMEFQQNRGLQAAMQESLEAALKQLEPLQTKANYSLVEDLLNTGTGLIQALNTISNSGNTIHQDTLDMVDQFVQTWDAANTASASSSATASSP
jgi:hypothetical protein